MRIKLNTKGERVMDAKIINPFIEASINIIEMTTGISPTLGKTYIKEVPYKSDNVLVLIGLTGKIAGSVVIAFTEHVACKIASGMMGMPVTQLDEIAKSAIGELCNMILGNTATIFGQNDISIDITPPTILTGDNIQLSVHKSVIVCIPLIFEDGSKMEIDISYVDKN